MNPLKDSSDSGQGSSRSTLSHASSSASILTSSPSPNLELDRKDNVKNRLGIKMTPSATQLPDERIMLFQRAQMRLPSLGHASPTPKPLSAQKSKRKTSEDCISVLSMSSVHAIMSDGNKHEGSGTPAFQSDLDLEASLSRTQANLKQSNSKRKISLEDNSPLLQSRRRSSTFDSASNLQDNAKKGLPTDDHSPRTNAESLKMDCSPASKDRTVGVPVSLSRKRNSPSQELSAVIEPLSSVPPKVAPMDSSHGLLSTRNRPLGNAQSVAGTNMVNNGNKVGKNTPRRDCSPSRSKGPPKGEQKDKNGAASGPAKRPVRTLEVLPVAKVNSVDAADKGLHGAVKKGESLVRTSIISASVEKTQSQTKEQELSSANGPKGERSPVRPGDHKEPLARTPKESSTKKLPGAQSKTGNQKSRVQGGSTGAGPGVSPKVASQSDASSQSLKTSDKKNSKQVKGISVSKPAKETSSKPNGKSAIMSKDSAAIAAKKRNENVRKQQGNAKMESNQKGKSEAVTRQTSWRISCDDDDSSESDFEGGETRFVVEAPVKEAGTSKKKQKCGKKATPLPVATKTDNLDDLLESSDAEDVYEEVIFSKGEETSAGIPVKKGQNTPRKDTKKVLAKEVKSVTEQMKNDTRTGIATGEAKKLSFAAQQKGPFKNKEHQSRQEKMRSVPLTVSENRKGDKPKDMTKTVPMKSTPGPRYKDNEASKQKLGKSCKTVMSDREVKTEKRPTPKSVQLKPNTDKEKAENERKGKLTPRVTPSKVNSKGSGGVKSPRQDVKENRAVSKDSEVKEKEPTGRSSSNHSKELQQQREQNDSNSASVKEHLAESKESGSIPVNSGEVSPGETVSVAEQKLKKDEHHIDPAVKVTTSEQTDQKKGRRKGAVE